MKKLAIKIENLSKQYHLGQIGTGTLSHDLNRWWHQIRRKEDPYLKYGGVNKQTEIGKSKYTWALKGVNFELDHGKVLGIIGKNGAGKSTLLKILSKVTGPTTGKVSLWGRTASLLEVGTGFHPELTGRENIFLNGAMLGMTKQEIKNKLDEIIDFSGCERYIDTPIKRYSSGMKVRLAFAVAAHLEPEILIVDEVLAVGDAEFQEKALGKLQEASQQHGRTVLFVSHNMATISQLCSEVMVIDSGSISFRGQPVAGIKHYLQSTKSELDTQQINSLPEDPDLIWKGISISQNNIETSKLMNHLPFEIGINYMIKQKIKGFRLFISLEDTMGNVICKSFFDEEKDWGTQMAKGTYSSIAIIPQNLLVEGIYYFKIFAAIRRARVALPSEGITRKVSIVETGKIYRKRFRKSYVGNITLPIKWATQHD